MTLGKKVRNLRMKYPKLPLQASTDGPKIRLFGQPPGQLSAPEMPCRPLSRGLDTEIAWLHLTKLRQ